MKVIVAGSRTFNDFELMTRKLNHILQNQSEVVIVSGTARGADQMGEQWAKTYNHSIERYPAQWDTHGKSAGYIRNKTMANNADALIAFWDGKSRGTKHMIDLAHTKNLKVCVIRY